MGWTIGVRFPTGVGVFSPRYRVRTSSGVQGVKRLSRESDRLHLVQRLRMYGGIPPLPTRLHGVVLSEAQGNFTFTRIKYLSLYIVKPLPLV
jgi:hypothetical protein